MHARQLVAISGGFRHCLLSAINHALSLHWAISGRRECCRRHGRTATTHPVADRDGYFSLGHQVQVRLYHRSRCIMPWVTNDGISPTMEVAPATENMTSMKTF